MIKGMDRAPVIKRKRTEMKNWYKRKDERDISFGN